MNHNQIYSLFENKKVSGFIWPVLMSIIMGLFYSCHQNTKEEQLGRAEQLVESHPGEALRILDSIPALSLSEVDYSRLALAEARSYDLLGKPIPSLAVIVHTRNFFVDKADPVHASLACFMLGKIYDDQNNDLDALYNYLQAMKWAEKANYNLPHFSYSAIPYNAALLYNEIGLYDVSLTYTQQSLKFLEEERGNPVFQLYAYELMSMNFTSLNQTDSAAFYLDKAAQIEQRHPDSNDKCRIAQHLAYVYYVKHNYVKAKESCFQAMTMVQANDNNSLARIYLDLSRAYVGANQLDSADFFVQKAKDLSSGIQNNRFQSILYNHLVILEKKKGNPDKATEYAEQAAQYTKLRNDQKSRIRSEASMEKNDPKGALLQHNQSREKVHQLKQISNTLDTLMILLLSLIVVLGIWIFISYTKFKWKLKKQRMLQPQLVAPEPEKDLKAKIQEFKEELSNDFDTIRESGEPMDFELSRNLLQRRDLIQMLEVYEQKTEKNLHTLKIIETIEEIIRRKSLKNTPVKKNAMSSGLNYFELANAEKADPSIFNESEYHVNWLMSIGYTSKEIAALIRIPVEMVEKIKKSINSKLDYYNKEQQSLEDYAKNLCKEKRPMLNN